MLPVVPVDVQSAWFAAQKVPSSSQFSSVQGAFGSDTVMICMSMSGLYHLVPLFATKHQNHVLQPLLAWLWSTIFLPSSNIREQVEFHDISSDGEDVIDAEEHRCGSKWMDRLSFHTKWKSIYGCFTKVIHGSAMKTR